MNESWIKDGIVYWRCAKCGWLNGSEIGLGLVYPAAAVAAHQTKAHPEISTEDVIEAAALLLKAEILQ